jgi:hypothetical protein
MLNRQTTASDWLGLGVDGCVGCRHQWRAFNSDQQFTRLLQLNLFRHKG